MLSIEGFVRRHIKRGGGKIQQTATAQRVDLTAAIAADHLLTTAAQHSWKKR
jgi:hypothetical protein